MCLNNKQLFGLAAAIFSLVTLLHAFRLFYGWTAVIGGWAIPMWVSWLGIVLAGYLAYSFWGLFNKTKN